MDTQGVIVNRSPMAPGSSQVQNGPSKGEMFLEIFMAVECLKRPTYHKV